MNTQLANLVRPALAHLSFLLGQRWLKACHSQVLSLGNLVCIEFEFERLQYRCLSGKLWHLQHNALVVNYGISNTIVLEIP